MDQAESLRRLVLRAGQAESKQSRTDANGKLVVVVGAQARVGVTTLVAHLGASWWRRGRGVTVIDSNWRAPALKRYVVGKAKATLRDVVDGEKTIREAKVTGPAGLPCVLAGPSPHGTEGFPRINNMEPDSTRLNNPVLNNPVLSDTALHDTALHDTALHDSALHEELDSHGGMNRGPAPLSADVMSQILSCAQDQTVIVDGGLVEDAHPLLDQADHCLLVLSADDEAALAGYLQMKRSAHRLARGNTWLVFNRAIEEHTDVVAELGERLVVAGDECLNLNVRLAGSLPDDESLSLLSNEGRLAKADASFSTAIDKLARRLELELGELARPWSSITLAG